MCSSDLASASTLELAVEQAIEAAAPDLAGMYVEGAVEAAEVTGLPLPMAANGEGPARVSGWQELEGVGDLADDELRAVELGGEALVVASTAGELLAFLDSCAACGSALAGGALSEGVLSCPGCERRYFLPRAGRSLDDTRLQLAPVPLLREGPAAKVALHA